MPDNPQLLVERPRTSVLRLTINDPERRNPLSTALFQALEAEVRGLDDETRVVVLTGAGEQVFVSGADLNELGQSQSGGLGGFGAAMELAQAAIEDCPAPVLARIQGHCLGAGYQLALACDLRVAVDTARVGVPASRFGLLPGPLHHRRMIQQLGPQVTRVLMLSGRSFSGDEAVRRGMVDFSYARQGLDAGVEALCDDIIAGAPLTVRNSKRMVNRLLEMDAGGTEMDEATRQELQGLSDQAHSSEDVLEGLAAFFERRKPNFKGR